VFRCDFSAGLAPARDGVFANPASPAALRTLSSEKMGDSPLHPVRSTAKKPQPRHGTPGWQPPHPHRARITTLPAGNRDRKARLIGPGSPPGSAAHYPRNRQCIGRAKTTAKERTRRRSVTLLLNGVLDLALPLFFQQIVQSL